MEGTTLGSTSGLQLDIQWSNDHTGQPMSDDRADLIKWPALPC
jgi:hypothetical protein